MDKKLLKKIGGGLALGGVGLWIADELRLLPKDKLGRWGKNIEAASILVGLLTWLA